MSEYSEHVDRLGELSELFRAYRLAYMDSEDGNSDLYKCEMQIAEILPLVFKTHPLMQDVCDDIFSEADNEYGAALEREAEKERVWDEMDRRAIDRQWRESQI